VQPPGNHGGCFTFVVDFRGVTPKARDRDRASVSFFGRLIALLVLSVTYTPAAIRKAPCSRSLDHAPEPACEKLRQTGILTGATVQKSAPQGAGEVDCVPIDATGIDRRYHVLDFEGDDIAATHGVTPKARDRDRAHPFPSSAA
jgi:hypothetical protein